jgi:ribonuclease BN (tRNA processing enzyme)
MNVRLTVVGCSPAWPNPGGAQSGYLLDGPGRLLLDCGPGVLASLRRAEPWPEVDAIAITHWHLDHWGDLVPWVWGTSFGPGRGMRPPELWIPPDGRDLLGTIAERLGQSGMFEQAFRVHEYVDGEPFTAAGFEILPHRVLHYEMLAFGFRVSAGGTTVAYSGDTGPCDALPEIARDADLFLCEATLDEAHEGGLRGHLATDEALAVFHEARARRLLLTHRPSERPLGDGLELAYDGLELEL